MAVVIVGTLDTKGDEASFVRDRLHALGRETLVIDAGSVGPPSFPPDVPRERVFESSGRSWAEIRGRGDRGEAVASAASGVAAVAAELHGQGLLDGVIGLGGSAGTVIGTAAMCALPFGVPKVMVSTLASGQTRPYVGGSDIVMLYPVADLAGLNRITRVVLERAAGAMAGMLAARDQFPSVSETARPLVTATMFGVTTPCVERARKALEREEIEVVVFHATGVGGQSMEGLIRDGEVSGVLDLTTTELADELVGGVLSAGPNRLAAAVARGVPQVVSVGALDMVNFGTRDSVPQKFEGRRFHAHNASVTLMRTTAEENAALGRWMAEVLGAARSPVVLQLPLRGVSALDAPDQPFQDPDADRALFESLKSGLSNHPFVRVEARDEHINDPSFADAAVRNLLELLGWKHESRNPDGDAIAPPDS